MGEVVVEHGKDPTPARARRWPRVAIAVAVVLVIATAGLWAWSGWLPGYRPALQDGERHGIDVSNHQGDIDWRRVAGDGMAFAYLKATEGGDYVDAAFARNWAGARDAGLDRGAYHFFTLCRPGADQAANFLATVPDDPDALPPVVDLELGGNCADRPDRAWVEREVTVFVERVEAATGQRAVVYLLADLDDQYHLRDSLDRPRWERSLLRRPAEDGWWIWQVSSKARVDGVDGGVDLNVMSGRRPPAPS